MSAFSRRRLRRKVATDVRRWIGQRILLLLLSLTLTNHAEPFTNSATLSAAPDNAGTNLVITYSLTTTQGWVTLFAADRPELLATKARPVDLAPVPPAMTGHFTVPLDPAAPSQFYRLLIWG